MRDTSVGGYEFWQNAFNDHGVRVYVWVKDTSGVFQNISAIQGFDYVTSIEITDEVDAPVATATVRFRRAIEKMSLSPYMNDSPLNRAFNPAAGITRAIEIAREIKIEAALVASFDTTTAPTMNIFQGYIDDIDVSESDEITVKCRDLGAKYQDAYLEADKVEAITGTYGFKTGGCAIWQPGMSVAQYEFVLPTVLNGYFYYKDDSGTETTGSTEPTWPTIVSNTVVDGSVTWKCAAATNLSGRAISAVIGDLGADATKNPDHGAVWEWYDDGPPSYTVVPYQQSRGSALEAMRTIAGLIGWQLKYRYKQYGSPSGWTLMLKEVRRSYTGVELSLTADQLVSMRSLSRSVQNIRNVVRVIYSDPADLAADGVTPKRKVVEVTNSSSVTKYGRRFCEISEASTSQINTSTKASNLANRVLDDLCEPTATSEVEIPFFPWMELNDQVQLPADGVTHDGNLQGPCTGFTHTFTVAADGQAKSRTVLRLRFAGVAEVGRCTNGADVWLNREARFGGAAPHKLVQFDGGAQLSASQLVGGSRLKLLLGTSVLPKTWDGAEIHVSKTPGFTPSSSTLAALARSDTVVLPQLEPGVTYYAKAVPRGINATQPILGATSPQTSFVAGYANPAYLNPDVNNGVLPLNGGFEAWTLGTSQPPDHWTVQTGAMVTNITQETSTVRIGNTALKMTGSCSIRSSLFPIGSGHEHKLTAAYQVTAGSGTTLQINLRYYNTSKSFVSSSTVRTVTGTTSGWVDDDMTVTPSAGFYQIEFVCSTGATAYVDKVEFYMAVPRWFWGWGSQPGVICVGGGSAAPGIYGTGGTGDAPGGTFDGTNNGVGVKATGSGSGDGLDSRGGSTGDGVYAQGGPSGGHGITATGVANDTHGGVFTGGDAAGEGIRATGNPTATSSEWAHGVRGTGSGHGYGGVFVGGTTDGYGIQCEGGSGANGHGIYARGTGTGSGVLGEALGTGHGVIAQADTTSPTRAAFRIVPQDADPTTAAMGDLYVKTGDGKLRIYNGAAWVVVGTQT